MCFKTSACCLSGKSSVDPNTYFAMMNQEYVFFVLEAMSTAAANLQEKCAIERNILVSMSAIVLVAQNLLSSQDALYRTMDIVVPILEGTSAVTIISILCTIPSMFSCFKQQ